MLDYLGWKLSLLGDLQHSPVTHEVKPSQTFDPSQALEYIDGSLRWWFNLPTAEDALDSLSCSSERSEPLGNLFIKFSKVEFLSTPCVILLFFSFYWPHNCWYFDPLYHFNSFFFDHTSADILSPCVILLLFYGTWCLPSDI